MPHPACIVPSGHMLHSSTPVSSPGHRCEFNPPSGLRFPPVCVHSFVCVCVCVCVCVFSSMQVHHVKVRVATITVKTFTVPSPHGPVLSAFQATLTLFLQPSYSSGLATGYVSTVSKFGHFSFKSDAPASIPKCYIDGCTQYATFQD